MFKLLRSLVKFGTNYRTEVAAVPQPVPQQVATPVPQQVAVTQQVLQPVPQQVAVTVTQQVPQPSPIKDRYGEIWTVIEVVQLQNEIASNMSISDMSKIHKRTVGGITSKIEKLIKTNYISEKDCVTDELIELYKKNKKMTNTVTNTNVSLVSNIYVLKCVCHLL